MELPSLYSLAAGRSILTAFGGLNESYACGEAEFTAMENFSSRGYPALQTRTPRRVLRTMAQCNGMYHLNGMLLCDGKNLRYQPDGTAAAEETVLENAVENSRKIMIGMGTRVLIWPDAVSFDTASGKLEHLRAAWEQNQSVTIAPCDAGGATYTVSGVGVKEPESPTDGQLFLKQNSTTSKWAYVNVLERFDTVSGKWTELLVNNVKLELPGLEEAGFRKGDNITLSGLPDVVETTLAKGLNGEVHIEQMDGDSIVLTGTPQTESTRYYGSFSVTAEKTLWTSLDGTEHSETAGSALSAERRVPKLEYVTENANRVWGCNSEENVIYSCKLGDPTNWYAYNGIASDSYAVNVGSDGPFTGAATCMGYVLFFKENCLHKLYGRLRPRAKAPERRWQAVLQSLARGGPSTAWVRRTWPRPWAAATPRTPWPGRSRTGCRGLWETPALPRRTRRWRRPFPAASTTPCRPLWRPTRTRPLMPRWATRKLPGRCSARTRS